MQTLTDCEMLSISKNDLEKLYSTNQKWQYFGRKLMENFLIEKEERIIDQISLSGQQKYQKLLETNPEIIQHVQVKYIASFLGLKPESLSRIKKQIN
jgi:CRP-like cAMP-binding protein